MNRTYKTSGTPLNGKIANHEYGRRRRGSSQMQRKILNKIMENPPNLELETFTQVQEALRMAHRQDQKRISSRPTPRQFHQNNSRYPPRNLKSKEGMD
jgi:hypothetical protein